MLYAIVAVIALILDQCMKVWTVSNIVVDTGEAKLIPGLVHFANVHNSGAAFSFLEGARWFFVVVCIIFVLVVIYALAKDLITHPVCRWSAVFVLAGALGNCIDRIFCGYVVDMFEFDFLIFKRPFPVFNVADIFITCGAIAFCLCVLLEKPQPAKTAAPSAAAPAAEAEAEKPAKKPLVRKHHKVEIPVFPKHDPAPAAPAIDPNDPFAEWEKRANAPKEAPAEKPAAPTGPIVYTQPAAAEAPAVPAQPAAPAEPAPEAPAAPAAPTQPAEAEKPAVSESFNLDDILAEFKDL